MKYLILILSTLITFSCKKVDNWLDKKYDLNKLTPSTLEDYQKLLDRDDVLNSYYPVVGSISADNFFLVTTDYLTLSEIERNAYTWNTSIETGYEYSDWSSAYSIVGLSNIVLEGLDKIEVTADNSGLHKRVRGSALFYRSFAFFNLAQIFAKQYAPTTLNDLGIPIRTVSDPNVRSVRSSINETYNRITTDLVDALDLLPEISTVATRPSKRSATALLAKVFLQMGDYVNAERYSSQSLSLYNTILDYNTINSANALPFPNIQSSTGLNSEVLFYAFGATYTSLRAYASTSYIDTTLYDSYSDDDLRKAIFFRTISIPLKQYVFRGSYLGNVFVFSGLAVNEVYLIRAEALARLGRTSEALADLNTLMIKRWKNNGSFVPFTASTSEQALDIILAERRKELIFTGLCRWSDLRRLNLESTRAVTLTRTINNQTFTLPPNDLRYVYLIPETEIRLSGIQQNPR